MGRYVIDPTLEPRLALNINHVYRQIGGHHFHFLGDDLHWKIAECPKEGQCPIQLKSKGTKGLEYRGWQYFDWDEGEWADDKELKVIKGD